MIEDLLLGMRVLGAMVLVCATTWASYAFACRIVHRGSPVVRWCATGVISMTVATLGFHCLMALHKFTFSAAIVSTVALAMLAVATEKGRLRAIRHSLKGDTRWLHIAGKACFAGRYKWLFLPLITFVVVKGARLCILPPLGWDELTLHAVKAGLWVQGGGDFSLEAPGGWGAYQHYFGGSQIFLAWAMLPIHGDLFLGLVDFTQWIYLALAVYAFGGEFGLGASRKLAAALYVSVVPTVFLSVGSGYSELSLNGALLASLLFAFRFFRRFEIGSLFLSIVALGLAGNIKITGLVILVAVLPLLLVFAIERRGNRWCALVSIGAGTAIVAACIAPWIVRNLRETGFPMAYMPIEILDFKLGYANGTITWYMDRPKFLNQSIANEISALKYVFNAATSTTAHLSALTLVPLTLLLPALVRLTQRNPRIASVCAVVCLVTGASYFQPGFAVIRILWASFSGRFLLPLVCLAVPLSFLAFNQSRFGAWYCVFLFSGALVHALSLAGFGWSMLETTCLGLTLALPVIAVGLPYLAGRRLKLRSWIATVCSLILVAFLAVPLISRSRTALRYGAAVRSVVFHNIPTSWIGAAARVDNPETPAIIAVTGGANQDADRWFLYYFLGRKLQNRIVYVPVSSDGKLVDFWPPGELARNSDYGAWLNSLKKIKANYVMSFEPASLELFWMEANVGSFELIHGDRRTFGLYRLIPDD